jgi:hypothetical protein
VTLSRQRNNYGPYSETTREKESWRQKGSQKNRQKDRKPQIKAGRPQVQIHGCKLAQAREIRSPQEQRSKASPKRYRKAGGRSRDERSLANDARPFKRQA